MPSDLSSLGRFAEPSLLILSSLAGGPKHGYAITKDVEEWGGSTLGPGTLYAALARLEKLGLIEALPAAHHHAAVGGAFNTVLVASLVALGSMLAAGVPIERTTVRQALAGRRELLGPLVVVVVAVVWPVGTVVLLAWHGRPSTLAAGQMGSAAGFYGWTASLVLAAAVGVAGAVAAVRRTELGAGTLRFAAGAAVVTTAAMVVMLVATVAWGLALRAADPA